MESLLELYNKILLSRHKWDYYGDSWYQTDDIVSLFTQGDSFIRAYLGNGQKLSDRTISHINELNRSDRIKHTLSIYFLGILFYEESSVIRGNVDKQLSRLERRISHDGEITSFSYYWFLICFFHDLGYCIENKSILEGLHTLIDYQDGKLSVILPNRVSGIPSIIKNNIYRYFKYRYVEHECIDHGFIGAKLFYDERHSDYYQKRKINGQNNFVDRDRYWSNMILYNVHKSVAWTIAAHNVWFDNGRTRYTDKYRENGLEELIIDKPIVSIARYPLLCLLSIVDSIDPTKFFLREINGINIGQIQKSILINFSEESFSIDVIGVDSEIKSKYFNMISKIAEWVICNVKEETGIISFDFKK